MKYKWLKDDINSITCDQLSEELGVKVKQIRRGLLEDGTGIEIEFEGEPAAEKLYLLDRKFAGLKRQGVPDLADEFAAAIEQAGNIEDLKAVLLKQIGRLRRPV